MVVGAEFVAGFAEANFAFDGLVLEPAWAGAGRTGGRIGGHVDGGGVGGGVAGVEYDGESGSVSLIAGSGGLF